MKVHIVVGTLWAQLRPQLQANASETLQTFCLRSGDIRVLLESWNYVFYFFQIFSFNFFLLHYLDKWYRTSGPLVNLLIFNSSNKNKAGDINSRWNLLVFHSNYVMTFPTNHLLHMPALVAHMDAPSNWRPGGRGFNPAEVGNILSWRLIMKYFLQSFSPVRWLKKGSCQFLAKEYWLTA